MKITIKKLIIKNDPRGWLIEIIRPEDIGKKDIGQLLLTVAYPQQQKGNHYHKRKIEWFCVVKGKAVLFLEDMKTHEKKEIEMGESNMVMVGVPSYVNHILKNIGNEDAYILAYNEEAFNPSDPDTFTPQGDIIR